MYHKTSFYRFEDVDRAGFILPTAKNQNKINKQLVPMKVAAKVMPATALFDRSVEEAVDPIPVYVDGGTGSFTSTKDAIISKLG